MAFQQYNSAALKERRRRQQEYEEYLAKKMSEEEDKRQKKYGFMLEPPNVIPNYMDAPAKKGEGNLGVDTIREGKIFTPEPTGDDRMSPALRDVFFRPIEVAPINPRDVMKRGTRKKHSASSARYYQEGRRKTAKIYGKKNKEKPKKVKRSKSAPRGGRRKRRKQRGGNTANCETAKLSYHDLANKIDKILEVKVPNWWHMNDGPYKLVEYDVEDEDAAEMGKPGIFGIGLETPDGENGFFIPKTDIEDETVRLCAPSVDNDTAPAGGRRKKRRKTRKNKRSKKGGYDSCVGKTPTPEEYCANILDIPVSNAECDDNTGLCLQMEETVPLDFSPESPDYDPNEMEPMLPDDDFSLENTTSGGARKKRRKTRKNKRSKKRRGKKRKTRKRRKKRR